MLSRDATLRSGVLEAAGWTHDKSAFDLMRQVTPDLDLAEPGGRPA